MQHEDSEFVRHEPCPSCTSSDAFGIYDDGHGHCFSCGHHTAADGAVTNKRSTPMGKELWTDAMYDAEYRPLLKRGITEETCKKFQYKCGRYNGKPVQVANYVGEDGVVAQKVRFPNKDFIFNKAVKNPPLYGMHLWRDTGKMVVITEGEIDAMSVSQLQGNKWPVVSVPNGAQGAKKSIAQHIEWLEKFESVILMFDMDDAGSKASKECALLFSPGKAKIAHLPLKDANEMLLANRGKEVIDAIWGAKVYRPDGIVSGEDTWEAVSSEEHVVSVPYPWDRVNDKTLGLRLGEITTVTAGSGIGKSTICREIEHHLIKLGETVGIIALEESVKRSALGLMSIELNKPLHITGTGEVDEAVLKQAWGATVGNGRVFLYDHWGSLDSGNLLSKIRFLARGCGVRWVVLDHISIVVSGLGDGDERRLIDNLMTELRSLVEETGIGMILVSHLKRPDGKGHEEGAQTSMSQLRGSAAIGQLSDMVIGVERDQQGKAPDVLAVRVLKNRFSGQTGVTGYLKYEHETGRLLETTAPNDDDEEFSEETF